MSLQRQALFSMHEMNPKFEDFNTIIYGHHVRKTGSCLVMWLSFADQEFFDQHRYGSIYYNGVEKGLEIFEMLEVDAYDFNIYDPGIKGEDHPAGLYRSLALSSHSQSGTSRCAKMIVSSYSAPVSSDATKWESYRGRKDYRHRP